MMFIKDIEPIGDTATSLLEEEDELIDRIIELPLRKACKIFKQKGIETMMSSANKNNILKPGNKPTEKDDVYGTLEKLMEGHYFTEAGNGYAWIMINYNALSVENKELLFKLEERKDENGNSIGERLVWFVHPFEMNSNIEYGLRTGKYTVEYLEKVIGKDQVPRGIELDETLNEFDKRHIVLLYPWEMSTEAVMVRMPIDSETTVEAVEQYFVNLAKLFKKQEIKKDSFIGLR